MGNSKTKPESPPKESGAPNSSLSYSSVPFQLQIRNCLRNVRGNSENSFNDVCPDQCAPSTSTHGQGSSVYTIDIGDGQMPSNYLNAGYSISETGSKSSQPNDGLPSYEEAVGKTAPSTVTATATTNSNGSINQPTVATSEISETGRGHRGHRRHRRHRHHREDADNNEQQPSEDRRRNRRRGFRLRRHLAKMGRNQSNE